MASEVAVASKFRLGFTSLNSEVALAKLPVEGTIPAWLTGSLFRNGPAKFELGDSSYSHWFDGLAMLHRYSFHNGAVSYRNRFLESGTYRRAIASGKLSSEFGTNEKSPLPIRVAKLALMLLGKPDKDGYNTSVSVVRLGDTFMALTEPPQPTVFNPHTLQAFGAFHFNDKLGGQVSTPHPHYDNANHQLINYLINMGRKATYNVYRMPYDGKTRYLIGSVKVRQPSYMHSFATTENYVILTEFPLFLHTMQLLLSGKPYIENFEWLPQHATTFYVLNKKSGELAGTFQADTFFAFHHINAYEQGGDLFVDIAALRSGEIVFGGYLASAREAVPSAEHPPAVFRRYRVPLAAGASRQSNIDFEQITAESLDMPTINPAYAARPYRYAYGVSVNRAYPEAVSNQLVKVDTHAQTAKTWHEAGCYPGEPIFVARPGGKAEDDGVALSVVLDGNREKSFLLVLDGQTFEELGRAHLPHHVPLEFHGLYVPDVNYRP